MRGGRCFRDVWVWVWDGGQVVFSKIDWSIVRVEPSSLFVAPPDVAAFIEGGSVGSIECSEMFNSWMSKVVEIFRDDAFSMKVAPLFAEVDCKDVFSLEGCFKSLVGFVEYSI